MRNGRFNLKMLIYIFFWVLILRLITSCDQKAKLIDAVEDNELRYAIVSQKGSSNYGDRLIISKQDANKEWHPFYQNDFQDIKPWKIEIADIDDDGKKEILIAVYKTTHFDDQEKNRMFVFNFDGEKLYKKWTGSQIAGIWNDFFVGDLLPIRGNELIFIEQMEDKKERIRIYYWFDFGFIPIASSDRYTDITDLNIIGENRMQITNKASDEKEIRTLMVTDGRLKEIEHK